jgi:hypothetical protein
MPATTLWYMSVYKFGNPNKAAMAPIGNTKISVIIQMIMQNWSVNHDVQGTSVP